MTSTFPTEEMKQDRGAALLRIRKQQRDEETRLRREMDLPVWRDWMFWLGVLLFGARIQDRLGTSEPTWPLGLIVLTVALDRVSRRRSRAARDLQKLLEEKELFLNK